jgi:hypothetical protein
MQPCEQPCTRENHSLSGDTRNEATQAQAEMPGIEPSLPVTLPSRLFHQDKTTGAFDQMLQHGL